MSEPEDGVVDAARAERSAERHDQHAVVLTAEADRRPRVRAMAGGREHAHLAPHRVAGEHRAAAPCSGTTRHSPSRSGRPIGSRHRERRSARRPRSALATARPRARQARSRSHRERAIRQDARGAPDERRVRSRAASPISRTDIVESEAALDAAARQQRQWETGGRHHGAFDTTFATYIVDRRPVMAALDQRVRDREAGHDVTGGAAARDHGEYSHDHTRVWRATDINMPHAASVTTSDDPPNDKNGNGKPVTGSSPTATPMLMNA